MKHSIAEPAYQTHELIITPRELIDVLAGKQSLFPVGSDEWRSSLSAPGVVDLQILLGACRIDSGIVHPDAELTISWRAPK